MTNLPELKKRLAAGRFAVDEVKEIAAEALAVIEGLERDAERWRKWLPWMRNLRKMPFDLAKEIKAIDAARTNQEASG